MKKQITVRCYKDTQFHTWRFEVKLDGKCALLTAGDAKSDEGAVLEQLRIWGVGAHYSMETVYAIRTIGFAGGSVQFDCRG